LTFGSDWRAAQNRSEVAVYGVHWWWFSLQLSASLSAAQMDCQVCLSSSQQSMMRQNWHPMRSTSGSISTSILKWKWKIWDLKIGSATPTATTGVPDSLNFVSCPGSHTAKYL